MVKKRIDIITLGCSKNLVDSEKLMRQFSELGYEVHHDSDNVKGEIVVINTCGFIGDAKEESINMILEFVVAKSAGKIAKLYVMGCLSERYMQDLKGEIPEVDGYFGKFNWEDVIKAIGGVCNPDIVNSRILTTPHHYAYLKISEGCNRQCAYCAIPMITGRYKSRPEEEIIKEANELVTNGVVELQLIAQDLTYYGLDNYGEFRLPSLVEKLAGIPELKWLRLHYAYPARFPYELLPIMNKYENVCKYLDIALQHINGRILKRMRRNITKKETYALIERIRCEVPGIHLRTTLMVGFPGETAEEFEELLQFVKDMRFERMGAFAYSEEEGTYSALNYKDDIPSEVKEQRLERIMQLQESISEEINSSKIGTVMQAVIDREEEDYYVARTEYDSPEVDPELLINKAKPLTAGKFYNIRITSAGPYDLFGEVE